MNLRKFVSEFRANLRSFGALKTTRWLVLKTLYQFGVRCMVVVARETNDSDSMGYSELGSRFRGGFMKAEALLRFVGSPGWDEPGYELSREGLITAECEGKQWYAMIDGEDKLACIMWFSCVPTTNRVAIFCGSDWAYGGGAFTHPDYRGSRLFLYAQARAANELRKLGKKGIMSDIEWRNLQMLRASYRAGYEPIGFGWFFKIFGKEMIWNGPGLRRFGFRYAQPAELSNAKSTQGAAVAKNPA